MVRPPQPFPPPTPPRSLTHLLAVISAPAAEINRGPAVGRTALLRTWSPACPLPHSIALSLARNCTHVQKNILGLVQGQSCRLDVEFKTDKGVAYKRTAPVKAKSGEVEEVPLYTNKDDILGEARSRARGGG